MKLQKIKAILTSTLLIGLVAISSCSRHEKRYLPNNYNLTTHVERISRKLDLNQDQLEQLEVLISNLEEKRTAMERGHSILDDIGQQLTAVQFDEKYVANSISNYLEEVEAFSLDFVTKISTLHETLSGEQRVKLAQHLSSTDRDHNNHYWR